MHLLVPEWVCERIKNQQQILTIIQSLIEYLSLIRTEDLQIVRIKSFFHNNSNFCM